VVANDTTSAAVRSASPPGAERQPGYQDQLAERDDEELAEERGVAAFERHEPGGCSRLASPLEVCRRNVTCSDGVTVWRSNDHSSFQSAFQPDKSDELRAALAEIITPARATEGVINLDIARDLIEPSSFIATATYDDGAALERQESIPEVDRVMAMLPESLVAPP
jgi:quinol monooxygenase YgiN